MQTKDTDAANTKSDAAPRTNEPRPVPASITTLRRVLLPVARLYSGLDVQPEENAKESPKLTANERVILADATRKFAAEGDVLLRNWRQTGEFSLDKSTVQRDSKTGAWPEPSLSLVAELVASLDALQKGTLPATREKQDLLRAQAELEMKRLELEEQRLDILQEQIKRGARRIQDPGPILDAEALARQKSGPQTKTLGQTPAMGAQRPQGVISSAAGPPVPQATQLRTAASPAPMKSSSMEGLSTEVSTGSIQDCTKVALCDLLLCYLDLICSNGTLDWDVFKDEDFAERLLECLGVFLCTWMNCYVNQLCPQKDSDCLQVAGRCDFAVEEVC